MMKTSQSRTRSSKEQDDGGQAFASEKGKREYSGEDREGDRQEAGSRGGKAGQAYMTEREGAQGGRAGQGTPSSGSQAGRAGQAGQASGSQGGRAGQAGQASGGQSGRAQGGQASGGQGGRATQTTQASGGQPGRTGQGGRQERSERLRADSKRDPSDRVTSKPGVPLEHTSRTAILRTCADTCYETFVYCTEQGGDHVESEHLQCVIDCAEMCTFTANFVARGSEHSDRLLQVCAEICKACEESCEEFGDDERMKACADVCRECYEHCTTQGAEKTA
jgi:hypothetical protein